MSDVGDGNGPEDRSEIKLIPLSREEVEKVVAKVEATAEVNADPKPTAKSRQFDEGLTPEQIRALAETGEHKRSEQFKDQFGTLMVVLMWAICIGMLALGAVWILNIVLPIKWRWLDKDSLSGIQSIITGGALVSLLAEQFRKRMGPAK